MTISSPTRSDSRVTPAAPSCVVPLHSTAQRCFTPFWSGQAAPMGREMPAKALTVKLATEALERFKQLGGLSKSGPSPLTVI